MQESDTELKLVALEREGLDVISAHVQNTCVRREDMAWSPKQKRFVLSGMRYDWVGAKSGLEERVGTVLRFERVLGVSHLGLADKRPDDGLNLLAVTFEKTEPPSGMVFLTFADGSVARLEVECLEAELRDVGPRQPACECPGHALTRAEAQ